MQSQLYEYFIGVGSNLGERESNVRAAIALLGSSSIASSEVALSDFHYTDALLLPGSPPEWDRQYVNAACKVISWLPPEEFLWGTKSIEVELGRKIKSPRWTPRVIDLDILIAFYFDASTSKRKDAIVCSNMSLTIPHKELLNRAFALAPLLELDEALVHPITAKTIKEHLEILKNYRVTM